MKEFRWQVLARWVTASILALAALITGAQRYVESATPLFAVCAAMALYNLGLVWTGWLATRPYEVTLFSQLLDITALTIYLHYSGDLENPLMFAYTIPVVAGAFIVSKRAGFLLASLGTVFFFFLVCATLVDAFPVHLRHHHLNLVTNLKVHESVDPDLTNQGWGYILFHTVTLTGVLFGSAYGFGTLSERIRENEKALQHENDRVQLLLSILPQGVALLSPEGRVILANPAATSLVGIESGGSVRDADIRVGISEQFANFTDNFREFECNYRQRLLNHVLARRDSDGAVVWIIRDLTEQHRIQALLIHRSKMADLGLLGAGIAHEIGNPLSSVSAILQLIEMRQQAPDVAERLRSARAHIDRMSRILQDMRDFARPSPGRRSRASARELVEKALHIFRLHEKSRQMSVDVTAKNGSLVVDAVEDQIVQVILNLLLNAADASGNVGAVSVRLTAADSEVRIDVIDRGSGMSQAAQEHLFAPFYTTKEPGRGVGLGLFVSDTIVRAHGGRIDVQSQAGQGSVFTICLPKCGEDGSA